MGKTPGQKAARVKGFKMSESEILRKIAVIFVTDVVGFSTLMAHNEELTLRSFRSCKEILDNLFEEHSGRIFNTAGDSVLAEFPSAVSAVICAVEFQKLIKARNASVTNAAQMQFRIGLNMGDVIIEGTNLYGDGVNVAARLEALSQAGGVCLSKSIHDFVSQKVDLGFQDIGAQQVKNTNVHAFDVSIGGLAPRQIAPTPPAIEPVEAGAPPSIAILPFKNMSTDAEQEYFADGVTEDIISHLALWKTFPVVSRNSSFSVKGLSLTASEISDKLNARYLVEGSIRKAGNKVRISASLTDALKDRTIWSERWDRPLDDIFEVQDEISIAVARAIDPEIRRQSRENTELSKPESLTAWDLYLQALQKYHRRDAPEGILSLCDEAIQASVNFLDPYLLKCKVLLRERFKPHNRERRAELSAQIFEIASYVVGKEASNAGALAMMASYYFQLNDLDNARHYAHEAFGINPNNSAATRALSLTEAYAGNIELAYDYFLKTQALDPSEWREWPQFEVSLLMVLGRMNEALDKITRAVENDPENNLLLGFKVAALGNLDRLADAQQGLEVFLQLRPDVTSLADYAPLLPDFVVEAVLQGMQKAGLKQ